MRGKKAKELRKMIYGDRPTHTVEKVVERRVEEVKVEKPGAGTLTYHLPRFFEWFHKTPVVDLRRAYQAAKRGYNGRA